MKASTLAIVAAGAALAAYGVYYIFSKSSILPRLTQPSQETTLPPTQEIVVKTSSADLPPPLAVSAPASSGGFSGAADAANALYAVLGNNSTDVYVQPGMTGLGAVDVATTFKPAKGGAYIE